MKLIHAHVGQGRRGSGIQLLELVRLSGYMLSFNRTADLPDIPSSSERSPFDVRKSCYKICPERTIVS